MAWRRSGNNPLSELMLTQFTDAYMPYWGKMSFNQMNSQTLLIIVADLLPDHTNPQHEPICVFFCPKMTNYCFLQPIIIASWWLKFCLTPVMGEEYNHDEVIKWKHFTRYWPFVPGIHRSPVNSPHKDQWRGALMFSLICAWINSWVNNREAGDLRRRRTHYDVTVMFAMK